MNSNAGDLNNWKPRFFTIWFGQAFSLVGSALTQFVLVWWITQETGSASALAVAGMMAMLPAAIFSLLGGAVADRFSRRMVMIVSDSITAGCMLLLVILFSTDTIQLWHIYTLMFIRSTMQSFQRPAVLASTQNLVPNFWLDRVAGMNQTMEGVMTIGAAPLGAVALAVLPTEGALMIDVVTALIGIIPLFFFRIPQPRGENHESTKSILHDIREGANYILHHRGLLMLYAVLGLVVLTVMPAFALTPLLVKQHFNGGVNEVAIMEGLAGVGIILGGVFIGLWPLRKYRIPMMLGSFAISCVTVAFTAWAPVDMLWLAVFWWFVSGVTYSTGNAPMMALLQSTIPNELQGRTMALLSMVMGLAGPFGLAIAGLVGETYGVRAVFIGAGVLSGIINIAALFSRSIWQIEKASQQLH